MMKPKGHYAKVNDIKIYYETLGKGPPLLMLHGGTVSSECWSAQLEPFARHFQLILPDSRGHGRSTDSDQPFSYAVMASDMVELLNQLKIKSTLLCGWSDGGIIGLHLSIHHPGLIKRQILIGVNFHVNGLIPVFRAWLQNLRNQRRLDAGQRTLSNPTSAYPLRGRTPGANSSPRFASYGSLHQTTLKRSYPLLTFRRWW